MTSGNPFCCSTDDLTLLHCYPDRAVTVLVRADFTSAPERALYDSAWLQFGSVSGSVSAYGTAGQASADVHGPPFTALLTRLGLDPSRVRIPEPPP